MRNAGRLKLGYFPLPIEEARNIGALLMASAPYAAIDPCAGNGTALIELTKDTGACLLAIELDADRAAAAAANGITTVHGSAFETRVVAETCSLLYLNPPYDTELGPHSNQRMELVFLDHCYRWLKTDGVLVFVIPAGALGTCARLLASQFDRITVYRLDHPESVRFRQIVVLGKRKKSHLRGDPAGTSELNRAAYRPELLAALNESVQERYAIPPSRPAAINYVGLPLDAIEDALPRSAAMQNARGILVRKQQRISGRPVTPLHRGHVGLLATAGMLNGFFGEGENRHIAHWRSVKYVDEFQEESNEEGEVLIHKRERFSHELTLAFHDGRILELRESKEGKKADEKCA
jgi:predicted RNA methylase